MSTNQTEPKPVVNSGPDPERVQRMLNSVLARAMPRGER